MPAEVGLDRDLGVAPDLEAEGCILERLDHGAAAEEAEVAPLCPRPGIERLLLRDGGEIGTLVEFGDDRLGFILGLHQDVAGMHLIGGHELGELRVEDLAGGVFGHRSDELLAQIFAVECPLPCELQPAGNRRVLVEAVGLGGLAGEPDVHDEIDEGGTAARWRNLAQLIAELGCRECEIGFGDRLAVDDGNDRALLLRGGGPQQANEYRRDDRGQAETQRPV